jgi:hypothetical protein
MPKIAEFKNIDGQVWVRVDMDLPSPITLWTDAERNKALREAYDIGYDDRDQGKPRDPFFHGGSGP